MAATVEHVIADRALLHVMPSLARRYNRRQRRLIAKGLSRAMARYEITTRERAAHFIAQVAVASAELAYRRAPAGLADHPYRSGGYLHTIRGRRSFELCARETGVPVDDDPALIARHANAATVAAWWWQRVGLNETADRGPDALREITLAVTGGYDALQAREGYHRRAARMARWLVPSP